MIVICIEGCHGSGKTELCKFLAAQGKRVLDEAFIGMPKFSVHPQSLIMQNLWIANWFERLLVKQKELGDSAKEAVFVADRSPFSSVLYSQERGELLDPIIQAMIETLRESHIYVYTAILRVERDLLWQRIQQRLDKEPLRKQFNEHSREWMDKAASFYEQRQWDMQLHNNTERIENAAEQLDTVLKKLVEPHANEKKTLSRNGHV